jgi:hypothetical protein
MSWASRSQFVRELLEEKVVPRLKEPLRLSPVLEANVRDLVRSVREQGLEGVRAAQATVTAWQTAKDRERKNR